MLKAWNQRRSQATQRGNTKMLFREKTVVASVAVARRSVFAWFVHGVALLGMLIGASMTARAATLPQGFQEEIVFSGLTQPTAIRFSPDGRVFVAEKSGLIKVFDNLTDTTPTVFADLRTQVHNFWDRGLLDIALAPGFPS